MIQKPVCQNKSYSLLKVKQKHARVTITMSSRYSLVLSRDANHKFVKRRLTEWKWKWKTFWDFWAEDKRQRTSVGRRHQMSIQNKTMPSHRTQPSGRQVELITLAHELNILFVMSRLIKNMLDFLMKLLSACHYFF